MQKIGFTGTRKGMTIPQELSFKEYLLKISISEFHHGDCVGSDLEAHNIINKDFNCDIIIHPPKNNKFRAFCYKEDNSKHKILEEKEYLDRNNDIVDNCDILVAIPDTKYQEFRSGTWSTIRYGLKQGKKVIIINPDGEIIEQ